MSRHLDAEVRGYLGLCENLAERLARGAPNEYDDMVQEGLIAVWLTLSKGKTPSKANIENRMKNWLRLRRRQLRDMSVDYAKTLPMEELRAVNAERASVTAKTIARRLVGDATEATTPDATQ